VGRVRRRTASSSRRERGVAGWPTLTSAPMCNAWNHPLGCDCGFGGDTGGGVGFAVPRESSGGAVGIRLTRPTRCWWCGADVYFYRDENGGCALFDDLGAPWEVHYCWERHRQERDQVEGHVRQELAHARTDSSRDESRRWFQGRPRTVETSIEVSGYIVGRSPFYSVMSAREFLEVRVCDSD